MFSIWGHKISLSWPRENLSGADTVPKRSAEAGINPSMGRPEARRKILVSPTDTWVLSREEQCQVAEQPLAVSIYMGTCSSLHCCSESSFPLCPTSPLPSVLILFSAQTQDSDDISHVSFAALYESQTQGHGEERTRPVAAANPVL